MVLSDGPKIREVTNSINQILMNSGGLSYENLINQLQLLLDTITIQDLPTVSLESLKQDTVLLNNKVIRCVHLGRSPEIGAEGEVSFEEMSKSWSLCLFILPPGACMAIHGFKSFYS